MVSNITEQPKFMEALALSPEVMSSSTTVPSLAAEFGAGIKGVLGAKLGEHTVASILGATVIIGGLIYFAGVGIRKLFGSKNS